MDDFTQMLDRARASGGAVLECTALNALAYVSFHAHRLGEMRACAEEALRVAERIGEKSLQSEAMVNIALKHSGCGELTEAKLLYDEVIPMARVLQHLPALLHGLQWRGVLYFFQTEYDRAVATLTEAVSLASEMREGFLLLQGRFFLGLSLGNLGRMSEALAILHEGLEMARRNGNRIILARVPNAIGWIYRELGDIKQAIAYDQESVEMARQHRIAEAEANSLINLGQDYTHRGEEEKSLTAFRDAQALFDRDEWNRWRFYDIRFQAGAAEHCLSQGNLERAEEHARRLLENAARHEAHKYIAVAHKLLAEITIGRGELADAEAELRAALDELRAYPVPIVAWKVFAALGRLHSQSNNNQAAREAFANAATIVHQIAANVDDAPLRETFLNSAAVREVVAGANGS